MSKMIESLKKGACFITHKLKHSHSVMISVSFRTGTLFENESNNGISHLVEHLFFRRLSDYSQHKLYYEMQKIGAEIIGKTYCDYVNFSITVVPKYFCNAMNLMLKFFDDFEWSNAEIENEKEVVCRQIDSNSLSYDKWVDSIYFANTNYAYPIMGAYESVLAFTSKDINDWKKSYFSVNNSCICITGRFSDDDYLFAKRKLNELSNSYKPHNRIIALPENFCKRNFDNGINFNNSDSDISEINILFDVDGSIKYENIRLLSSIIGEGCGSKLSIALREEHFLTDDIYTSLTSYYGFNRLCISYSVKEENIDSSLKFAFDTIKKMKEKITNDDLETSIKFFTDNQFMDLDNIKVLNDEYVLSNFALDLKNSKPRDKAKAYNNIKIIDLINTARRVFVKENLSFIIESHLEKERIKTIVKNALKEF